MNKKWLIIFVLLFLPIFYVRADVLIEKDENRYYYNKKSCSVIANLADIKKDYNFYYVNLSPIGRGGVNVADDEDLRCLVTYTGGMYGDTLVLVKKENDKKFKEYINLFKKDGGQKEISPNGFIDINLYKSLGYITDNKELSVEKSLFQKQPEDISETRYYNLIISSDNSVKLIETTKDVSDKNKTRSIKESVASIVAVTSLISIVGLIFIQRKINKKNG